MELVALRLKLLPLFLAFFLSSCIFEDASDCNRELTFDLAYTLNKDNVDLYNEQVTFVETFIYNEDGQLFKQFRTEPATSSITVSGLPSGRFEAIFLANIDSTSYSLTDIHSKNSMLLKFNTVNGEINNYRGSNFHGIKAFQFDRARASTEKICLTKNTNDVRIVIEQPGDDLTVQLEGNNAISKYDNSLVDGQPTIIYNPYAVTAVGTQSRTFRFTSLRLLFESEIFIQIYRYGRLIHTFPLNQTLADHSPLINVNEDLDRYDEYELTFRVNPNNTAMLASIRVNDWFKIIQNGGLE